MKFHELQAHSNTMDAAVREFAGAMCAGLGGEMDPVKLRAFVGIVGPLLGAQPKVPFT